MNFEQQYEFVENQNGNGVLGVGAFATVRLARDRITNQLLAVKIIDKTVRFSPMDKENMKREIAYHQRLDHPNIIKFHCYQETQRYLYIVIEYAQNGSVFSLLNKQKRFPEQEAKNYFIGACRAISYMHTMNLIHRDFKPENLLLDQYMNVKLCDFGWTTEGAKDRKRTFCGTFEYMAPEMINKQTYDCSVDIWGLGIFLYELLHGYTPFRGPSDSEIANNITRNQYLIDFHVSPLANELIQMILRANPQERPTAQQILQHQWCFDSNMGSSTLISPDPSRTNHFQRNDKSQSRNLSEKHFSAKPNNNNNNVSIIQQIKEYNLLPQHQSQGIKKPPLPLLRQASNPVSQQTQNQIYQLFSQTQILSNSLIINQTANSSRIFGENDEARRNSGQRIFNEKSNYQANNQLKNESLLLNLNNSLRYDTNNNNNNNQQQQHNNAGTPQNIMINSGMQQNNENNKQFSSSQKYSSPYLQDIYQGLFNNFFKKGPRDSQQQQPTTKDSILFNKNSVSGFNTNYSTTNTTTNSNMSYQQYTGNELITKDQLRNDKPTKTTTNVDDNSKTVLKEFTKIRHNYEKDKLYRTLNENKLIKQLRNNSLQNRNPPQPKNEHQNNFESINRKSSRYPTPSILRDSKNLNKSKDTFIPLPALNKELKSSENILPPYSTKIFKGSKSELEKIIGCKKIKGVTQRSNSKQEKENDTNFYPARLPKRIQNHYEDITNKEYTQK